MWVFVLAERSGKAVFGGQGLYLTRKAAQRTPANATLDANKFA
jgi:hypothetical protein